MWSLRNPPPIEFIRNNRGELDFLCDKFYLKKNQI